MSKDTSQEQIVSAPPSTDSVEITPLGYINSFDALIKKNYAYAMYKEENIKTGKWYFKIKAKETAGTSYDPDHSTVRKNICAAAVDGKDFIIIGFNMTPKDDDPRLVENRLYFDKDLNPIELKTHIITRNEDGSATEEQTLTIEWPGKDEKKEHKPLIELPKSTDTLENTELAYLHSLDVIINKDYAYLAYKEKNLKTDKWRFIIKATETAGTAIDPEHPSFRTNISAAAKKGEEYTLIGFNMNPDDDPRMVENRLFFDKELKPDFVEIHLVTRNADGSAKEKQFVKIEWPGKDEATIEKQVITTPESTKYLETTQLAYINSYDVPVDKDYGYVAYKEQKPDDEKWRIKIVGKNTAGAMIDPFHTSFKNSMKKAADEGKEYLVYGFNLVPKDDDIRLVENRIFFDGDCNPTSVEIHVITRNADETPKEENVVKFDWPG